MKIVDKDWMRMTDLVLSGKDASSIAKSITKKDKAIARFVAGTKLINEDLRFNKVLGNYSNTFSDLGNKALALNATTEEIQLVFDETTVPIKYSEKLIKLSRKKLDNRFVGALSKAILDAGYDIDYLPTNGNAITMVGRDAMAKNGRKWTIGYKSVIDLGDHKVCLEFDAITDEGDGPTTYVILDSTSDRIFSNIISWEPMGKLKFVSGVMEAIK